VGLVSDVNGLDDNAWNGQSWLGLKRAREAYGVNIGFIESAEESDYAFNINQSIEDGTDIIVTIGAGMAEATGQVADENPQVPFIIVGHQFDPPKPNVLGVTFSNDKGAFLAGYLAAGFSQSGLVGTFGGMEFPPVNAYMVGFQSGVNHYNQEHGSAVEVLGVDRYIGSFDSEEDARQVTEEHIAAGADIIMPVAGPAGHGAAQAILEHEGVKMIGVDFDWCARFEEYCPITLASVALPFEEGVFQAISMALEGEFEGGAISAVGQLPLHDFEGQVSEELLSELEALRQALAEGSLATGF
jgi:basic membrane protein A